MAFAGAPGHGMTMPAICGQLGSPGSEGTAAATAPADAAGRSEKAALPLAALAHQLFLAASSRGAGAEDDSQVIGSYRALNGK